MQQVNRNEMKNNNENTMTIGDTNANQITPEVRTVGREVRTNDLAGQMRCLSTDEPENITQLDLEQNQLRGTTIAPVFRLPSNIPRELHKDCRTHGVKDTSKTIPISRGHSLSNLRMNTNDTFSVVLSKSDADLVQHASKDKIPRTEGIKRLSLGRSRKLAAKTEVFGKEFVGRVSGKRLLSASLDSIDTSHHLIRDMEKASKTSTDHFLGIVFHPTDSASEENIAHCSKLLSTSETKTTNVPTTEICVDNVPDFSKQSTPHPALVVVKSSEIFSGSEAQLDHQGGQRGKTELKSPQSSQSNSVCQQKFNRVMLVEFLGCPKEENNIMSQNKMDYESEVNKVKSLHLQESCSKVDDPYVSEVADSANNKSLSGNNYPSLGRGSSHRDCWAVNQVSEKYVADREVDSALSLADDNKPSGKLTPTENKHLHNGDSNCIQVVGGQNINLSDNKRLDDNESKAMLIKGNTENVVTRTSDSLEQPTVVNAESLFEEHASIRDNDLVETIGFSIQSKKAIIAKNQVSNDPLESCRISAKSDTFLCAPTALRPVATADVNNQLTVSNSNLKELYTLHIDKLSSGAVLPPIDGTQLQGLCPIVPNKTACNSGIPKPILVHSKGSYPIKGDGDCNGIEKLDENVEMKPDIPKPKQVRPKIITYIRRNPQAIGHLDHAFAPAGLPYVPPACSVPMAKDQKTSSEGDMKPTNILYDKFKPDLQKPHIYSTGLVVSGIKASGHHFGQMGEKFLQEVSTYDCCSKSPVDCTNRSGNMRHLDN